MDAAGMDRAAMTHWFGHSTVAGMTGIAIQMLTHQGQVDR